MDFSSDVWNPSIDESFFDDNYHNFSSMNPISPLVKSNRMDTKQNNKNPFVVSPLINRNKSSGIIQNINEFPQCLYQINRKSKKEIHLNVDNQYENFLHPNTNSEKQLYRSTSAPPFTLNKLKNASPSYVDMNHPISQDDLFSQDNEFISYLSPSNQNKLSIPFKNLHIIQNNEDDEHSYPFEQYIINNTEKTLLDRIQEDFPRTPSPTIHEKIHCTNFMSEKEFKKYQTYNHSLIDTIKVDHSILNFVNESDPFDNFLYEKSYLSTLNCMKHHSHSMVNHNNNPNTDNIVQLNIKNNGKDRLNSSNKYMVNTTIKEVNSMRSWSPRLNHLTNRNHYMQTTYSMRSMFLETFRMTLKIKNWTLNDILGHIVEFSQDQHGSRFIQQQLASRDTTEETKNNVFNEIYHSIYPQSDSINQLSTINDCNPINKNMVLLLVMDVFGNYVIQKLLEYGTDQHRHLLCKIFQIHVVIMAYQIYGCRVLQKALEVLSLPDKYLLLQEMKKNGKIMKLIKDQNGNHVIQKCIELADWQNNKNINMKYHNLFPLDYIEFIMDTFHGQVYCLATHPYGCRVLQTVLDYCDDEYTFPIYEEIEKSCFSFVQDQYANYVVQHVLEKGTTFQKTVLIHRLKPQILLFSKHKYASNVMEKCFSFATYEEKHELIQFVLNTIEDDENLPNSSYYPYNETRPISALESMIKDPYANYVVQKIIDEANHEERLLMIELIRSCTNQLRKYTYGKHIVARLEKLSGLRIC